MAHPEGFTGNPDIDVRILFSLPDRELVHLCSASKYLHALCIDPANEVYWQARYQQYSPYWSPVAGISWREAYWKAATSHLSPEFLRNLARDLRSGYNRCTIQYLGWLGELAYAWVNSIPYEVLIIVLSDYDAGIDILNTLHDRHPPPYTRTDIVEALITRLYSYIRSALPSPDRAFLAPWWINERIQQSDLYARIFPQLSNRKVPLTITISETSGTQQVTLANYLGIALYVAYQAPYVRLSFRGCSMNVDKDTLTELSNRYLEDSAYIILMPDSRAYGFVELAFMQGFVSVARWLGQNYRLAYDQIIAVQQ